MKVRPETGHAGARRAALTKGEASPFARFALWVLPVDKRERRLHQWNPDPEDEIHDA